MADSIAKLAVIITGDASPLADAMAKASAITDKWARGLAVHKAQTDKWNQGMEVMKQQANALRSPFENLNTSARKAATGMQSLHGQMVNVRNVMSSLRGNMGAGLSMGGLGGGSLASMAAMVFTVRSLARSADNLHQSLDVPKVQTWTGQWERLTGVLGTPFALVAREATEHLANIAESLMPDSAAYIKSLEAAKAAVEARKAAEEKSKEAAQKAKEAAREAARLAKERADAAERERDAISDWMREQTSRAEQIRRQGMSPLDELKEDLKEYRALVRDGFLSEGDAATTIQKRLGDIFKKKKVEAIPGVAAAERFTAAGFSAGEAGKREADRLEKAEKQQTERLARIQSILEQIRDAIKNNKPIEFTAGDLN